MWIIGPSKFDIANNSISNGGPGVVSIGTGSMNNNQHNYVQKNAFSSNSGSIAMGLNRELQILCNDFNTDLDIRVLQNTLNADPGEIRLQQGSFLNGADNCFTQPVVIDISTLNLTTHFYYNHGFSPPCLIPTTPGNYTPVGSRLGVCERKAIFLQEFSEGEWNEIVASVNAHKECGDTLSSEYYDLIEIQEAMLLTLLKSSLEENNIDQAMEYLNQVNTPFAKLTAFGIYMNDGKYENAETVLANLDSDIPEMSDFKQIQAINIARLQDLENYKLSESDQAYLESVAESGMGVKAYARSILSLLKGIEYLDEYIEEESNQEKPTLNNAEIAKNQFKISPNPFYDLLSISILDDYQSKTWTVTIKNFLGKTVNTYFFTNQAYLNINASNLTPGFYSISISNKANRETFVFKLIKQ